MSGRVFLAEEAGRLGLVNDVVPPEQLMDHVLHYAADVAANSSPDVDGGDEAPGVRRLDAVAAGVVRTGPTR